MSEIRCKWAGRNEPRVVPGRHNGDCADPEACEGCAPCPSPHCGICQKAHADVTCAECVAVVREDLHLIATLCGALPAEVAHRGINGEAMMLLGPSANPEAWNFRKMSAIMGRVDHAYLDDCRDEQHPVYVLGSWDGLWREELDHPTDLATTLPRLVDYLDRQMAYMSGREEPPFEDFARELRGCRGHLEDVLMDGERDEKGAPCLQCGKAMTRVVTDAGAQDSYNCRTCHRTVTGEQYHYAVGVAYRAHADSLTARDMHRQYDVSMGSVRGWATSKNGEEPKVRKRGKDANGLQLYDVGDVLKAAGKTKGKAA